MNTNYNFINGTWVSARNKATYPQRNPADLEQITGLWPKSGIEDVEDALDAAGKAYSRWSDLTVFERGDYLKKALLLMKERVPEIASVITAENGKTLGESRLEIRAAIKEMEFQINEGLYHLGEVLPSMQEGVLAYSTRRPLGVVAVIAPWNFPFNVPVRKCIPALIAGNTCILKPAMLTPGAGAEFVKLFEDAGLPAGVLNFVSGSGSVAGNALVKSPAVKAISFTGSTEVGTGIHQVAAANLTRTQLEMGGKNAMVILRDADLEKAAHEAFLAAFVCSGQWCTATSRIIVEKVVLDDFLKLLIEKTRQIGVGSGASPDTEMGPVCGEVQLKNILAGIEKGKAEGAKIHTGGRQLKKGSLKKGCFIEPTIFTNVKPDMYIAQEEIFGPVLSVIEVDNFEQAMEAADNVRFGLSSSIFTNDLAKAHRFIDHTDVGLTHVNMSTAYKEPQLSFGGIKQSGFGIPEAGHTGIEFFTDHKVVYLKSAP